MLSNWLKPTDFYDQKPTSSFEVWQLGFKTVPIINYLDFEQLPKNAICLIGLNDFESNRIRDILLSMSSPSETFELFDLGNTRTEDGITNAIISQELIAIGATPIFIGRNINQCLVQYFGYHNSELLSNLVLIDDKLRFQARDIRQSRGYLDKIFDLSPLRLFHLSILGYQTHYVDSKALDFLHQHHFEFYRLGVLKYNIEECEPALRDADIVSFNISAIKASDAPGQTELGSSGFTSEEACQIARFCGMAYKVSSFGIYGFKVDRDPTGITADTIAQMVWYFIEGFINRKQDHPNSFKGLSEYVVHFDDNSTNLKFWKSESSGRWWMEIPYKLDASPRKHFIPCSYNDYLSACEQQLPERLIDAYKRFI